jgi:hypothetical protein
VRIDGWPSFPELRNIANSNGGLTMMLLDRQRSSSSEGVYVLENRASSRKAGLPSEETANAFKGSSPGRELPVRDNRAARWAALSSSDRKLFNLWARAVVIFYSAIVIALLTAMWLGVHSAGGAKSLRASPENGRSSAGGSAPVAGSMAK